MAEPSTIASLVKDHADDDRIGLIFEGRSWTWSEVVDESTALAHLFNELLDARRPRHVGVLMGNRPDYVFALLGGALAGVTIVGINATRRGGELQRDILHTDCQLVLTDDVHLPLLTDKSRVDSGLTKVGASLPAVHSVDHATWSKLVSANKGKELPTLPSPDSLFVLIFTSGSTAAPKAVRRSQARMAQAATLDLTSSDVLYCAMPLSHGNALAGNLLPALKVGATVALREKFSASEFLADAQRLKVTYANTVGRALGYILATPATPNDRDNCIRFVLAPEASQRDAAEFATRFGTRVLTGYGSSEAAIAMSPSDVPGAMGRAKPTEDVVVVDPMTLQECPPAVFSSSGQLLNASTCIGEVVRRDGLGAFEGYYGNDEAARERVRNGWYHSGDLAYRDDEGVFYFAGRIGDWLRVDAENFAAAPVERILARHPDVAAVVVYAVPDPRNGDLVMTTLELREGRSFDPQRFFTWLGAQDDLGTKWAPTLVRICPSIPVTSNDKLDKRPLQQQGWRCADPVWWRPPRTATYAPFTTSDADSMESELTAHHRSHLAPWLRTDPKASRLGIEGREPWPSA